MRPVLERDWLRAIGVGTQRLLVVRALAARQTATSTCSQNTRTTTRPHNHQGPSNPSRFWMRWTLRAV
ncbi:hypothetical protein SVAN01_05793 [Stagonosporopsis vannaccii]|nr:hypothetical protein SVAN01_05793 [Stagonosporopsis vannaccii]